MSCIRCGRHLHLECGDPCCCSNKKEVQEAVDLIVDPLANAKTVKSDFKDPKSTGRKRAAHLYPLDPTAPCEWQLKKNCGGGKNPIIGCLNGLQKHRHHGPNKDTLHNEMGNVHRICNDCHNRWHYFNDASDEYDPTIAHSPVAADVQELIQNELDWAAGKFKHLTSKRWAELNNNKESVDD